MKKATRSLLASLTLSLVVGALFAQSADAWLFGLWKPKKSVAKPPEYTLVVFPFDQGNTPNLPEGFGEAVASDVRTMLANSDRYAAFLYRSRLAPIQRAKEDNVIKTSDMEPPFAEDRAKTFKLAQLLAAEYYLVGEIDDYQIDRANRVAEITLKADLYDGKTGKLIKTFLVTGRTPESATGDEDELRDIAKGFAVTKLVAEILASQPGSETKPAVGPSEAPKEEPKTPVSTSETPAPTESKSDSTRK